MVGLQQTGTRGRYNLRTGQQIPLRRHTNGQEKKFSSPRVGVNPFFEKFFPPLPCIYLLVRPQRLFMSSRSRGVKNPASAIFLLTYGCQGNSLTLEHFITSTALCDTFNQSRRGDISLHLLLSSGQFARKEIVWNVATIHAVSSKHKDTDQRTKRAAEYFMFRF